VRGVVVRKSDRRVWSKFDHPGDKVYQFGPSEDPEDFEVIPQPDLPRDIDEIPINAQIDENYKYSSPPKVHTYVMEKRVTVAGREITVETDSFRFDRKLSSAEEDELENKTGMTITDRSKRNKRPPWASPP